MRLRLFAILVLTIVLFLALSTSCNSRSVGPKREIQKDIDIIGLFRGLKEGDDPVIIHIYNLDTGIEHGKISVPGKNGPFEMGIGSPEEGQVYTLIAEAQGYSVQPESYKIRILGDRAYFVSNNETGEKVLILDFSFVPESPPAAPAPAPTPVPLPPPAPLPPGPGTPGAANDDIVSAPGGFTYRASIHQQGQPDWPPVQGSETALSTPLGYIGIGYRSYIETLAGETRNNIIYLDANNAPEIADPIQVDYHPVGLPVGITLVRGMQGYGGIGGQDRESSRVVLVTQIAPTVKPGDYPFLIQLEYEGEIFGSLPVTVKVK